MNNVTYSISKKQLLMISLGLAMLAFTFIDFVRRFHEGSKWLLVALDYFVVLVYLVYFGWIRKFRITVKHRTGMMLFIALLFAFFCWTILELFNTAYPSVIVSLAGLRTYWLAVPMIFIGYYLADKLDIRNYITIYRFILTLSVIVISFAVIQLVVDRSQLEGIPAALLTPMGHGVHSYGQEVHELVSSFFAGSKRYGKYLLFCYLVLWAINKARDKSNIPVFLLFSVGMYVGGSREALWMFLLFHVIYILFVSANRIRNQAFAGALATAVLLSVSIGTFSSGQKSPDHSQRSTFLFALGESVTERILIMVPFTSLELENEDLLFGIGPGRYGSEALLVPSVYEETYGIDKKFFYSRDFFSGAMSFADAGLTKIVVELGLIGLVLYLAIICTLLFIAVRGLIMYRSNSFTVAASYWVIAWVVLFFKAHTTISDLMLSVFLFGAAGYVMGSRKRNVKECIGISAFCNQVPVMRHTGLPVDATGR